MVRSQQTITIEEMLREGRSVRSIALLIGITRQRVMHIRQRLHVMEVTGVQTGGNAVELNSDMTRQATIQSVKVPLTQPIYDALVKASKVAQTSPEFYVEELILTNLAERGLLKHK